MRTYIGDKKPGDLTRRLPLVVAVVSIFFAILMMRLWYIQLYKGTYFEELSINNRVRLLKAKAPRGLILDRNGYIIAGNTQGFNLSVIPEDMGDIDKTINKLTGLINIDAAQIKERLKDAKKRPAYLAVTLKENLSWKEMSAIEGSKWNMPGIILESGPHRNYPYGNATSHITGYLGEINDFEINAFKEVGHRGYTPGDKIGKYGLEKTLEPVLRGIDGGIRLEVDAKGNEIRAIKSIEPYRGNSVRLTIDLPTQLAAWNAMEGKTGAIVALDPRSGNVLALVSTPSFDPNLLTTGLDKSEWRAITGHPDKLLTNRAIKGVYPPASTFKVVTAAAALETNVITKDTKIKAGGAFKFAGETYRNWKKSGHGSINIHRAIVESADTFFYPVALQLGLTNLHFYASQFGFGSPTGIDLGGEYAGLLPSNEWKKRRFGEPWYDGETIHLSIGQGYMLSTPLQLANAYSAIANGGTLYKPKLIDKIETFDGHVIRTTEAEVKNLVPLSEETITILRAGLRGVVTEKGGTAGRLRYNDFKIAGKTGTAQVVRMKKRIKDITKIPYKFRDHALFAGFAPFDNPEIVVAVIVEHGGFGSKGAAPLALDVISAFMSSEEKFRPKPDEDINNSGTAKEDEKI